MDENEKTTSQTVTDEEESQRNLEQDAQDESEQTTEANEQTETVEDETSHEAEDQQEEEQKPPSRRENLRIRKLIDKLREKEDGSRHTPKYDGGLNYREHLEADDDTVKQLESDRQKYGEQLYNQGFEQAKSIQFHTRLEIDAPRVAAKYKQFDPDAPEFSPVLASTINEWYLQSVGFDAGSNTVRNANTRYLDFVEGIMELSEEIAGQKVANTTKNIAKQAASTGIRPNGSTAKSLNLNQAPEDMTDEELDAMIGGVIPPKKRR